MVSHTHRYQRHLGAVTVAAPVAGLCLALRLRPDGAAAPFDPAGAAAVATWLILVVVLLWWSVAAAVYAIALRCRSRALRVRVARITPAWIRAMLERAATYAVVGMALTAPVVGAAPSRSGAEVAVSTATADTTAPSSSPPIVRTPPPSPPVVRDGRAEPPAVAPPADPPPSAATLGVEHHVVRPGESLWLIARDVVRSLPGGNVDDAVIAPYWRRLVDVNRATLRSGNPNLIYPGEVIGLPPTG